MEAIRSIPHEFREMVYRVCVEDKKLVDEKEKTNKNLTDKNIVFYRKMLLVLGLERLLKFYLQKNIFFCRDLRTFLIFLAKSYPRYEKKLYICRKFK